MRAIRQTCLALLAVFLPSGFISAAEIYSASLSLDPAYDAGGCALVSSNGYGGTDRQLFIAPTDAYYSIKDYSSNNTQPLITVEAFDPTTRLDLSASLFDELPRKEQTPCPLHCPSIRQVRQLLQNRPPDHKYGQTPKVNYDILGHALLSRADHMF